MLQTHVAQEIDFFIILHTHVANGIHVFFLYSIHIYVAYTCSTNKKYFLLIFHKHVKKNLMLENKLMCRKYVGIHLLQLILNKQSLHVLGN